MNTTNQQTGEGNAPRKSNGAIRCTNALQYAAQRLSDAMQLYPPTHLEIAKRKLTFDLISNHAERSKTWIRPSGTVKQGRRPMFQPYKTCQDCDKPIESKFLQN